MKNAFIGLFASPGQDVYDSLFFNDFVGIDDLGASSATVTLTNLQFIANGYDIKNVSGGTYKPKVVGSSLQLPAGCHCLDQTNTCVPNITSCVNFGTSTSKGNTSFVDTTLYP